MIPVFQEWINIVLSPLGPTWPLFRKMPLDGKTEFEHSRAARFLRGWFSFCVFDALYLENLFFKILLRGTLQNPLHFQMKKQIRKKKCFSQGHRKSPELAVPNSPIHHLLHFPTAQPNDHRIDSHSSERCPGTLRTTEAIPIQPQCPVPWSVP